MYRKTGLTFVVAATVSILAGLAVRTPSVLAQAAPGGVRVIAHDKDSFQAATGDYTVAYHRDVNMIRITSPNASRADVGSGRRRRAVPFMAFYPGGGDPRLQVLDEANVRDISVKEDAEKVTIEIVGRLDWAKYTATLILPRARPGLINSRVQLKVTKRMGPAQRLFKGVYPELTYRDGRFDTFPDLIYYFNGTPGAMPYHTVTLQGGTIPDRNQFVFFGDPDALKSTVFCFTDYTSLNPYFATTDTKILGSVRQPPGCLDAPFTQYMSEPAYFGYDIPEANADLQPGAKLLVANTYLQLTPGAPAIRQPIDYCKRFIQNLANAYPYLTKPEAKFVNWPPIVERGLRQLAAFQPDGAGFRNVFNSCKRYADAFNSEFAAKMLGESRRGSSEIRAGATYGDAWQYFFPMIQIGDFAVEFNSDPDKQRFMATAANVVTVGRRVSHLFPQRLGRDFGRPDESTRYEYDVVGEYIYQVLLYYKLSGKSEYLDEAKAAAEVLMKMGFEYPYEFTVVPMGCQAMLQLYKLTGDKKYLEGSYIPLAAALRHSQYFNPEYGDFKGRNIYALTEAMPGIYANGWEEAQMIFYLNRYLIEGHADLMPEAVQLTSELLRYKCTTITDGLAPLLPDKSIIYRGIPREWRRPVDDKLLVPLEGFGYLEYDQSGFHDKPGRCSQASYCFGMLPEACLVQFHPLGDKVYLYCAAPVIVTSVGKSTFTLEVLAREGRYQAGLCGALAGMSDLAIRSETGDAITPRLDPQTKLLGFEAVAGHKYTVTLALSGRQATGETLAEEMRSDPVTNPDANRSANFIMPTVHKFRGPQVLRESTNGDHDSLEYIWSLKVPNREVAPKVTAKAYYHDAGDADTGFFFSYATNPRGPYTYLFSVTNTSAAGSTGYFEYPLPESVKGTVYIKVQDTDSGFGQNLHDTLYISVLSIKSGASEGRSQ